jgi:hypothetical protein
VRYTALFTPQGWLAQTDSSASAAGSSFTQLPVAKTNSFQTSDCHSQPENTLLEMNITFWLHRTDTFGQAPPGPQRETVYRAAFVVVHSY